MVNPVLKEIIEELLKEFLDNQNKGRRLKRRPTYYNGLEYLHNDMNEKDPDYIRDIHKDMI